MARGGLRALRSLHFSRGAFFFDAQTSKAGCFFNSRYTDLPVCPGLFFAPWSSVRQAATLMLLFPPGFFSCYHASPPRLSSLPNHSPSTSFGVKYNKHRGNCSSQGGVPRCWHPTDLKNRSFQLDCSPKNILSLITLSCRLYSL